MFQKKYWKEYRSYLIEMRRGNSTSLESTLASIKKKVEKGCSLEELRDAMLQAYEPVSIMQWLEQWELQMELFLNTPVNKLYGKTREDQTSSSTDDFLDGILNDTDPKAHICYMSGITQRLIYLAYEMALMGGDDVLKNLRKEAGLMENWELMMLQSDLYSYNQKKKKARTILEALDKKSGYADASVKQALFTLDLV